ncbi:LysM peptidoglycan-binding domain-containing protein [Fusicatenibacter sp.]
MSEEKNRTELSDNELDEVTGGAKAKYYYVQKGDELREIAKKYSTTVNQLCLWNGISNPNFIKTGDRLRVG